MSTEVEAPNLKDPFEAHAYWALAFLCDGCPTGMDFPKDATPLTTQFSREWFEKMAVSARQEGWTVDDPDNSGHYFDCYCPTCSAVPGRKKENSFRFEVRPK